MVAPESFDLDDVDGHAHATCEVVLDVHRDQVLEAVTTCPEQAITATVDHLQAPRAAHGDPQEQ